MNKFPKLSARMPVGLLNNADVPASDSVFPIGYSIELPAWPVVLPAIVTTCAVAKLIFLIELFT